MRRRGPRRSFVSHPLHDRKQSTVELNAIDSIPLFASVPRRRRWHVARLADEVGVAAGSELTRQAVAHRSSSSWSRARRTSSATASAWARSAAGDFFGEVGLLGAHSGAQRDSRRDVADASARARPAPVPRADVRRTFGRRADPRGRAAARLAPGPHDTSPPFPGRRHRARPDPPNHSQKETSSCPRSSTASATASTPQQMYGTLDAIKAQPELGRFQFRATNRWIDGAHNRTTIQGFYGAGQEDTSRAEAFTARRRRAGRPARHRHRPEPGRVPAARARGVPDDVARLRRRGAQGAPDRGRVDARGRHGRARRARHLRRRAATASRASA